MSAQRRRQGGQAVIMTTLALIPMFGMMGLVTDLGYMHYVKTTAQSAAEASAQAAVVDFYQTMGGAAYTCGGNVVCASTQTACTPGITMPANPIEHGCMYGQAHGFNSAGSLTYQAGTSSTPTNAPGVSSAAYWVTFRAMAQVPQLFSAVLGNFTGTVVARSTAALVGATDCIYTLDPTDPGAISIGGSASLTSSCGVFDNSNNACAVQSNGTGGGNGTGLSAPKYDIVGGVCTQNGTLTPAPNTGVLPISDPLSVLPAPASPPYTCNQNYPNGNGNGSTVTVYPGTYCGGIQVKNNTVNFMPGTYVLVGGGLTTQDSNSILSGSGVTFYNTFDSKHPYSPININANSSVTLTAPTSDTYAGTLFFDDRSAPTGKSCGANGNSSCDDTYGGGATALYQGTIYNRNNCITLYGNSSQSAYSLMVAYCITLQGTTNISNDYSSLPNGASPLQQVLVLE